eukprot:UN11892
MFYLHLSHCYLFLCLSSTFISQLIFFSIDSSVFFFDLNIHQGFFVYFLYFIIGKP